MSFWSVLKGLNYRQIGSLFLWFLKHPPFMFATVVATIETYRISQRNFPDIHGKHNKANAFRHALWNALIAQKCMWFTKSIESATVWAEKITNWHEDFSPNQELARAMDLHNNRVGRKIISQHFNLKLRQLLEILNQELEHSVKISRINDIFNLSNLVYIED